MTQRPYLLIPSYWITNLVGRGTQHLVHDIYDYSTSPERWIREKVREGSGEGSAPAGRSPTFTVGKTKKGQQRTLPRVANKEDQEREGTQRGDVPISWDAHLGSTLLRQGRTLQNVLTSEEQDVEPSIWYTIICFRKGRVVVV